MAESDFVVIACDLNSETNGLIGTKELDAMKPDSVIINVSRGLVIQENSLYKALKENKPLPVFNGGKMHRDFTFIDNVIQANILSATSKDPKAAGEVYNIAVGERTSLIEMYNFISKNIQSNFFFWRSKCN